MKSAYAFKRFIIDFVNFVKPWHFHNFHFFRSNIFGEDVFGETMSSKNYENTLRNSPPVTKFAGGSESESQASRFPPAAFPKLGSNL